MVYHRRRSTEAVCFVHACISLHCTCQLYGYVSVLILQTQFELNLQDSVLVLHWSRPMQIQTVLRIALQINVWLIDTLVKQISDTSTTV